MILLVDDNQDLMLAFETCLRIKGYESRTCASGQEALEYLDKSSWPSLILLDFSMPGMTGEEFLERLNKSHSAKRRQVKVVGMSCYAPDFVGVSHFRKLVDDYVEKPSTLDALESLVGRHLSSEES